MDEQHSFGWYRARLGNITGSKVAVLMSTGRGKGETFSQAALTYLYQVAAERVMNKDVIDDDMDFAEYLEQVEVSSKAMRFGSLMEAPAREAYMRETGIRMEETGSHKHPLIGHFASSPDGVCYHEDGDESSGIVGCLEVKVPGQAEFMRYAHLIHDNETLKAVKPEYYYQCMAHMMCTGAIWTDFVAYNPYQSRPLHMARILANADDMGAMAERIMLANDFIEDVISR